MGWTEFTDRPDLSRAEMIRKELSQAPTAENPRAWDGLQQTKPANAGDCLSPI